MRNPKYEGMVVLGHCSRAKRPFGITAVRYGREWAFTWAFPLTEKVAKSEGFDQNAAKGDIVHTEDYPGCPYCHTKAWVQCCQCHRFLCYTDDGSDYFKCPHCGIEGGIDRNVTEFDLSGGGY